MAKARLRRGIELVKLANRIEMLKMQEDESEAGQGQADLPADAKAAAAGSSVAGAKDANSTASGPSPGGRKSLSKIAKGAIFREVVLAKVREMKEQENAAKMEKEVAEKAKKSPQ